MIFREIGKYTETLAVKDSREVKIKRHLTCLCLCRKNILSSRAFKSVRRVRI